MKNVVLLISILFLFSCGENTKKPHLKNGLKDNAAKVIENKISSKSLFELVPSSKTRITVKNSINETENANIYSYEYMYNGGGVAVGDINNDGLPDLFFTINMGMNRLYINKGDWQFEDISMTSNIQLGMDWSTGVTMVDINNDGWLDIYLCRSGKFGEASRKNALFVNNKNNTFTEKAASYGLDDAGFSTQASFFDYDNDGDLDMYLANHPAEFHIATDKHINRRKNPHDFERDKLYRNDGGEFRDVSKKAGILNYNHSLGLITSDINNDGWDDIYVTSDYFEQDFYYINNGNGTFTDQAKTNMKHMAKSAMGLDVGDINNDGYLDLISVEMMAEDNKRQKTNMASMNPKLYNGLVRDGFGKQFMHNALQLNNGKGEFSEISYLANVATTDWSWSPLFVDLDNDGYQDLFVTNGNKRDLLDKDYKKEMKKVMGGKRMSFESIKKHIPTSIIPNYVYKNNKDLTFTKISSEWGLGIPVNSNGACYADIDGDGDMDLVVNNLDAEMSLFKNNSTNLPSSNYLKIKFIGPESNLNGLGTKAYVTTDNLSQYKQLTLTHGYQSSMEPNLHFGLASNKKVNKVVIKWYDGKEQVFTDVDVNQTLSINYRDASIGDNKQRKDKEVLNLKDITQSCNVNFKHTERNYNDYKDQILLPNKYSQSGPGLAVGDIDGNGYDDFYIGGAAGQSGVVFMQKNNGKFSKQSFPKSDMQYEDMGALFFDSDGDGDLDLYVVSGSYESSMISNPYQDRLYINNGNGNFKKATDLLPVISGSGSCIVAGDYDKDGDLDLFVGGRVIPKKYPYAPASYLLRNDNGKFIDVTKEKAKELGKIGMVTSAIWTDYDNDDDVDLIVVGEWIPITVFNNNQGELEKVEGLGLEGTNGWWNSITGGDIDNDGDIDYVLGNLGLNSKNKATHDTPFEVYCDDFDGNGTYDIALGYYNGSSGVCYPVRGRQCSSESVPSIAKKIPTYDLFGDSSIEDVYGKEALKRALHLKAFTMSSIVLINESGLFKIKKLPNIAQIAPNYGLIIEDINFDGCLDVFLVGNQFPVEVETGQYDAHKGLFLKGDCTGNFIDVDLELGQAIDGDTKSLALIRYGKDQLSFLVGTSNDKLRIVKIDKLKVQSQHHSNYNYDIPSGGERKHEYYFGSGYLSQSSSYRLDY